MKARFRKRGHSAVCITPTSLYLLAMLAVLLVLGVLMGIYLRYLRPVDVRYGTTNPKHFAAQPTSNVSGH